MIRARILVVGVASVMAAPGVAIADDLCTDALVDAPAVAVRDGRFDRGRSACLRDELIANVDGGITIDTPEFYGTIAAAASAGARVVIDDRWQFGVTMQVIDVTFVQNAVTKVTEPSYGPFTAEAAVGGDLIVAGMPGRWAALAMAELPFTRGDASLVLGGAQLGALVTVAPTPRLALHGRAAALGGVGSSIGGTTTSVAGMLGAAVTWRVGHPVSLSAGMDAQSGWTGAFDHLLVHAGAHFRLPAGLRGLAAAGLPLLGGERTDLVITLGVRHDL